MATSPFLHRLTRWTAHAFPSAASVLTFCLLVQGGFNGLEATSWWEIAAISSLVLGLSISIVRRIRRSAVRAVVLLQDELELGASLLSAAYVTVSIGGQALFPIVYLLMAFLVSFMSRVAVMTLAGMTLVFEALLTLGNSPATFAAHAAFLLLFAVLYHLVLSVRLAVARRAEDDAVKNRLREVEERARTFRLVSAGTHDSHPGLNDQEKWLLASVKEVEGAVGAALEIGETAMSTHTCAAFLLTSDERMLKLYDCRSVSDRVGRERFPAGEGILGGVLKRVVPVRMHSASGLKGITYYDSGAPDVKAILAVPIVEGNGLVRGVIVADRVLDEPFTERDEKLMGTLAVELLRAMEVERVMSYIRKSRDEKDRFFKAIEELNGANNPEQVFVAVLESTRQLAGLDFCAVTLVSEKDGKRLHRIARMSGVTSLGRKVEGHVFEDNNGLVANVVRYGAPLPGRELTAMDKPIVFDGEIQLRGLSALKIFPLVAGDRVLGTLVAGSRRRTALDHEVLRMIEVIAIQAAQAVLRAQLFEQMERMATTDGLTGLFNHRTFQAKAEEALAQAKRYSRKCSMILTDIDHFKSVNDTYGHPTGDVVLKGVAQIIQKTARDTDIVARYGGEEFAIVMPETDLKGAKIIAERIREAVMSETFQTELGPLKVTISLGISTCPDHHQEKQGLIDLSDQCLYQAKRSGRNRSVTANELPGHGKGIKVA
jgi:two-component system, cell cycle response regulator